MYGGNIASKFYTDPEVAARKEKNKSNKKIWPDYEKSPDTNPYTDLNDCDPITEVLTFTDEITDGDLSLASESSDFIHPRLRKLAELLKENSGKLVRVEMLVRDCSQGVGCNMKDHPLNSEEIADYDQMLRKALINQQVTLSSRFNTTIRRGKAEVYSHLDTPVKVELTFTYYYCSNDDLKSNGKDIKTQVLEIGNHKSPPRFIPKVHPQLSEIKRNLKKLDESVTYIDPITSERTTSQMKDTFYGIWYRDYLEFVKRKCIEDPSFSGINKSYLIGKPNRYECWDHQLFGNLTLSDEQWGSLNNEQKVRYYNDALDTRVSMVAESSSYIEIFHKKVEKALSEDKLFIESWQTGVLFLPASNKVYGKKVFSCIERLRLCNNDWDRLKYGSISNRGAKLNWDELEKEMYKIYRTK